MWREQKKKERQEKRRAHYEQNQEEIIQKVVKARKKSREAKSGQLQYVPIKDATKKRRRERNQQKLASENKGKLERERKMARERSKRYRQKKKDQNTQVQAAEAARIEVTGTPFPNRMAKKRAIGRAKKGLPDTPEKRAEIMAAISKSPRTRKVLEKRGLIKTPEEEKEVIALKALAGDLTQGLKAVKNDKSNKGRAALGAAKSLSFGENVKKSRSQKTLSKLIALDRRSIKSGIEKREMILKGEEPSWLETKRKTRRDAVTEETKEVVYDYWKMVASRPTGNKKDLIRKRVGVKTWVEHPKHVLEKTQTEAYVEFASMHPEIKISQRKFENLKPYFVRGARERDRQTCMCRQHVELQIVFKDCMKFRKRVIDESREANQAVTEVYTSVGNIIEQTLCPKPEDQDYHKLKCLKRECRDCGVHNLVLLPEEKGVGNHEVKWKRYDYVSTGKLTTEGKDMKKIALVEKCTGPKELFDYFIQLLGQFPYHSFLAKWQREQLDSLLENLPLDQAVCIHDYSEGYACRFQDEIQSQYFDVNKVSLHVTILYRHSNAEVDGVQSTEEEPAICKEHLFVISDDVTQDHDSVLHIQKLISKHLEESNCTIKKMHEFTDGCAGQYKSRHCYGDLSCSLATLGYTVQRNYFATSHAKGEQDAAGSHVKQKATSAVLSRKVTLSNAKDLCNFLKENFSEPAVSSFPARQKSVQLKRRVFFYLPSSGELSVARNREGGRFCTVKGIRQLHSVRTCSEQLKVFTRERSCYCHGCIVENFDSCENKEWVGNWKEIVLSREPSGVMTRTTEDASTIEHSVQVADLATKDSIVAVAAEEDSHYDYYLLKVTSSGVISLQENFEDPYSGSIYSKGQAVLLGNFFLRENIIDRTYKLDDKVAGVFPGTVRYICGPLVSKRRRGRPIYQVPLDEHEQILASL